MKKLIILASFFSISIIKPAKILKNTDHQKVAQEITERLIFFKRNDPETYSRIKCEITKYKLRLNKRLIEEAIRNEKNKLQKSPQNIIDENLVNLAVEQLLNLQKTEQLAKSKPLEG